VHHRIDAEVRLLGLAARARGRQRFQKRPAATVALGGTIGKARREVDLSISDSYVGVLGGASAITTTSTATPFLANAEASLNWQASPLWSARVFGGWNYDSKIPGIVRPNIIAGNLIPASIGYESLTSWYGGGGATAKFGP
jgi:hypothetical protein